MTRRHVLLAVAIGTLLVGFVAGCGLPSDGSPRVIANDKVPFDILSPTTAPSVATGTRFSDLYFVKDNLLSPEPRRVGELSPKAVLDALVAADQPSGSSNPAKGVSIKDAVLDGSTLVVTLGENVPSGPDQKLVFGQLVYTATELSTVSRLSFMSEDASGQRRPLSPPTDSGNVQDRPVDRSDYKLIAPTTTTTTTTTSTTRPGQTTTTRPRTGG